MVLKIMMVLCIFKKDPVTFLVTGSLVGAPGFEPGASWTRTKRDTKLRHTRIGPIYYTEFTFLCQEKRRRFRAKYTFLYFSLDISL